MKDISGAKDSVFFELYVPLVFIAKYRRRVFDARAIDVLRGIFADVCSDAQAALVKMDGEVDHVHLLVEYPPQSGRRRAGEQPQGCFQSLAAPTAP
jgi:REP element-mobilizing transposase RayT